MEGGGLKVKIIVSNKYAVHPSMQGSKLMILRVDPNKPPLPISCFPYILVRLHRIFKFFVPTPNNAPLRGGRDKNFEDPMQSDQDLRKTRYGRRRF